MNKIVEDTVNSLHEIKRAGPKPFFYARVYHRLQIKEENIFEKISYIITRPSFLMAGFIFIVIMNALVVSLPIKSNFEIKESERTYSSAEYTFAVNSFYAIAEEEGY